MSPYDKQVLENSRGTSEGACLQDKQLLEFRKLISASNMHEELELLTTGNRTEQMKEAELTWQGLTGRHHTLIKD